MSPLVIYRPAVVKYNCEKMRKRNDRKAIIQNIYGGYHVRTKTEFFSKRKQNLFFL